MREFAQRYGILNYFEGRMGIEHALPEKGS